MNDSGWRAVAGNGQCNQPSEELTLNFVTSKLSLENAADVSISAAWHIMKNIRAAVLGMIIEIHDKY